MGNGIALTLNNTWLPAGWVARNAAEFIIPELEGPSATTVKNILEDIFMYPGAIASFEEASPEEILCLYRASSKGIAACKEIGPDGWNRPELFPAFLKHFQQLLNYIAADERVSNQIDHTPFTIEPLTSDE